jgi:glyoxylase-like metal-dependent hydrolase (beta-lactamase superfamily II)
MVIQASNPMSRRNFCLCCLASTTAVAAGEWLTPSQAFAQARAIVLFIKADAASAEIAVHRLRRNVTVLQGSGGNIAVLTGDDGKLLIDAGIAVSRPQIAAALASLGAEPIRHLINTHWHFDHADGNAWIHAAGATILAHENTRNRLLATQYVEDWKTDFPPPVSGAIPTDVFADARTVHLNDTTIALKYYGPAHTDCDISVFFTEADVLHTGDIFWNGFYPFIDYSTGGSIDGTIRAADASLAVATDTTIIVPGHGTIGDKAQLNVYRDMLVAIRDNVAALKKQGRTLDDIVAAKPTAAYDAKWGGFVIDPDFFTKLVYEGV